MAGVVALPGSGRIKSIRERTRVTGRRPATVAVAVAVAEPASGATVVETWSSDDPVRSMWCAPWDSNPEPAD